MTSLALPAVGVDGGFEVPDSIEGSLETAASRIGAIGIANDLTVAVAMLHIAQGEGVLGSRLVVHGSWEGQ